MNQTLHLLIVDPKSAQVLATWTRSRWILPILVAPEHVRAGQPVIAWAADLGLRVEMIGQWLGRAAHGSESIDWLAVVRAEAKSSAIAKDGLSWRPIRELSSSPSCVDYQQWAVTEAMSRSALPSVPGPFGAPSWLGEARNWIEQILGSRLAPTITSYRTTAYEVALGFTTQHHRVFFKGLSADRASEARVTSALSDIAPDSFARTLALRTLTDGAVWWLMDECPGTLLAQNLTVEHAARVAAACGGLQAEANARLGDVVTHLPRVEMRELVSWGATLLRESGTDNGLEQHQRVIEQACAAVESANMTESVIPVDLDPSNVFLRNDEVRFIDLDDVHCGSSPLALPMFVRRFARAVGDGPRSVETRDAIYRAYERAWPSHLQMNDFWRAFEIASALLEAHLAWSRVQKKLRREEVRGVDDLVRTAIVRRLLKAIGVQSDMNVI